MSTTAKQVMDIRTSKGVGASSNEELRNWTDRGWDQAMKEGNYDRSRERAPEFRDSEWQDRSSPKESFPV